MKRSRAVGRPAFGPSNPEFQEHAEVWLLISYTLLFVHATPVLHLQRSSLQCPLHPSPRYHSIDPHAQAMYTASLPSLRATRPLTTATPLPTRTRTQVLELLADISHGAAWSPQDLVTLVGMYYLYICEPTHHPLKEMKWGNKSNQAVLRMLNRIRQSDCAPLKRHFPENPQTWTATEDADLNDQLQVHGAAD